MSPTAERRRRTPWRDNLEALIVAILVAVVLKYFIVEAYKIPSGSMQPTLLGDEKLEVYDRILVDKLTLRLRDPERWEVVVFRYPLERSKNFVKRVVGVGPEELRIDNGDVFRRAGPDDAWEILRRPRHVLRAMMRELDLGPPPEGQASRWRAADTAAEEDWSFAGRAITARGPGAAVFAHDRYGPGSIMDGFTDGYPPGIAQDVTWNRPAGRNAVADLRVEGRVRPLAGLERVTIELGEGVRRYVFTLPGPAAPAGESARIEAFFPDREPLRAVAERRLAVDLTTEFAAHNVDDQLVLELDGEEILALEISAERQGRSSVRIRCAGEGADLEELQVLRDVWYTTDRASRAEWPIPDGHYFMLGDNTQDSSDSREWRFVTKTWPGPGSEGEPVRGGYRHQENPRTLSTLEGRRTFFWDEWGERHVLPAGTDTTGAFEEAPFVPRRLILGRALLVFWPWMPSRDLVRLEWIR